MTTSISSSQLLQENNKKKEMTTPSSSSLTAAGSNQRCLTLSDVIESVVTRSLCPNHLFSFKRFRRGMSGLRRDLVVNPPSEEEESRLLEIFPSSFSQKMGEIQWQELEEIIEHPLGGRYERYCFDWVSYATTCIENCKRCSIFSDTHQRQKAYFLIRKRVLEEAESFEEMAKIRARNPPLIRLRVPDLVPVTAPEDDVLDFLCCQDDKNLVVPAITPPPGFEERSFFYQQD